MATTKLNAILVLLLLAALSMPVCGQDTAKEWRDEGWALYNQGKYDEAIQAYDVAIGRSPGDAWVWYYKGLALSAMGNYTEATQAYDEAIRLDPEIKNWKDTDDFATNLTAQGVDVRFASLADGGDQFIVSYNTTWDRIADDAKKIAYTLDSFRQGGRLCSASEIIFSAHFEGGTGLDWEFSSENADLMYWILKGLGLYNQGKNDEAVLALDEAIRLDPAETSVRDLKSAILVESAEPWQASNGAWITDVVTDTAWLDGWTPYQGQGFTVAIAIHSEDYTRDMFVVADGTLTLDGYVNKRKVWTEEFEVSRYDFVTYEIPLFGTKGVAYQSPRIPFSDLGVSKDTCVDIWMTFDTSGYTLEDESTVCT